MHLHCALCFIPFNLIFSMTIPRKRNSLTFEPTPRAEVVSTGKILTTMLLHVSFPLIWYAPCPYSDKNEFWFPPHPLSLPRGPDPDLRTKIPLIYFVSAVRLSECKMLVRNIDN